MVHWILLLGLMQTVLYGPLGPHGPLQFPPLVPPVCRQVVSQIPKSASLATNNGGGASLCGRPLAFVLPNPFYPQAWGDRPQAIVETVHSSRPAGPAELRRAIDECPIEYVLAWSQTKKEVESQANGWLVVYALLNSRRYGTVHYDKDLLLLRRGEAWTDQRERYLTKPFGAP